MMLRLLHWLQDRLPFIQSDAYPEFDQQMDAYLQRASENFLSAAMKERGPDARQEEPR